MYYIIYKITNQINGNFYIGAHKTNDLFDEYMGSGKYLNNSIKKYGRQNFIKEILFSFDNENDMWKKERELVNEQFISRKDTYNIKIGGYGGWDHIINNAELHKKTGKLGSDKRIHLYNTNPEWRENYTRKVSESLKRHYAKNGSNWKGKKHKESTKQLIGSKNSIRQKGSGNSQYGTRWIHSLELKISKKIKKNDPLPDGWNEGRKMKFSG